MHRKLLIAAGSIVVALFLVALSAAVFLYVTLDKAFIASRLSQALHRQVSIAGIEANLFSLFSGIAVKNVAVSHYKTPRELAALQGKPVPKEDLFAGTEALHFKLRLLPLLRGQIMVRELVLYSPVITLVRDRQGGLNIDDLLQAKGKPGAAAGSAPAPREPAKPVSVDALPMALAADEIGLRNGTIHYHDRRYDHTFELYRLTALARDIRIDPGDLKHNNDFGLKLALGIRTVGALKTGSVRSFDITIAATGRVIPFDRETRLLDPEVQLHVSLPEGEITGLQLFNAVAAIPILGDYLGEHLSFLKGKQAWKGAPENGFDLGYKAKRARLANGRLDLKEARLRFDGTMHTETQAMDLNLGMAMQREINGAVTTSLTQRLGAAISSPQAKRYIDTQKLALAAMQPLLNREGQIALQARVTGTAQKPVVTITEPRLGSLSALVREAAAGAALKTGQEAVKKFLQEKQPGLLDGLEGIFKK